MSQFDLKTMLHACFEQLILSIDPIKNGHPVGPRLRPADEPRYRNDLEANGHQGHFLFAFIFS